MSLIKEDTHNHSDSDVLLVVEIHSSLVTKEMLKYNVRDLLPKGRIFEDPSLVEGTENQVKQISKGHYNVIPLGNDFFKKDKFLSGYAYLIDRNEGMFLAHQEPVPQKEPDKEKK